MGLGLEMNMKMNIDHAVVFVCGATCDDSCRLTSSLARRSFSTACKQMVGAEDGDDGDGDDGDEGDGDEGDGDDGDDDDDVHDGGGGDGGNY